MTYRHVLSGAAVAAALGVCSHLAAGSVLWTASEGMRSAEAEFSTSGTDLVVRLTNVARNDTEVPTDVLTAVFFNVSGASLSLTRTSGLLEGGSTVFYDADGQPAGDVIGGEWAYRGDIDNATLGTAYGIGSAGFGIFGPGDLFPGANLAGPASPDGLQYGLLTADDKDATGNGGILGSEGLIRNSVVFTLGGLPAGFDLNRINGVLFQYGTGLDEPRIPGVPTPGALALIGAGALVGMRRRR